MPTVKTQRFDLVHDTQFIYRKLLDAMARPGEIVNIHAACAKAIPPSSFSKTLTGLAFLLLDTEVNFYVQVEEQEKVEEWLRMNTFSNPTSVEDVDFLFIDRYLTDEKIEDVICQVKRGTLQDPHKSATFFISVDELGDGEDRDAFGNLTLILEGPGISGETQLQVSGLAEKWLTERERVNEEYPTGVDIVLASSNGDIVALPRTTKIERRCQ